MKYFPGAIRSGVIKLYRDVTLDTFFNHNRLQSKLKAKGVIHHMIGRILTCEQDLKLLNSPFFTAIISIHERKTNYLRVNEKNYSEIWHFGSPYAKRCFICDLENWQHEMIIPCQRLYTHCDFVIKNGNLMMILSRKNSSKLLGPIN